MAHIRLHVQQADGNLPMICLRCGEPATVVKTKKMAWYPRGLIFLVLLGVPGIIILAILAAVLTKRARLQAPFCEQHQNHWLIRTTVIWTTTISLLALGIGAIVFVVYLEAHRMADLFFPFLCIGGVVLLVGWLILIGVLQSTSIRPDEITSTHILLNGVAEEFVQAVEEAEIERRVRLRQWQHEDEAESAPRRRDDDVEGPTPRKPPAATDAIEEPRPPRPAPPPDAFEE
jgi:hypothetical protein